VLKIGAVLPLTGAIASYGIEAWNGLQMVVDAFDADLPVELEVRDNASDVAVTERETLGLIQGWGASVLIGAVGSTNAAAAAHIAQREAVPLVAPGASHEDVTNAGEYVSRTCFIDPEQARALAHFMHENLGKTRAVIVEDQGNAYSLGLSQNFASELSSLGGEVVSRERFATGESDFTSLIHKVRDLKPDVVFLPGYYGDIGPMLAQSREAWADAVLLGGDGLDSPRLMELAGELTAPLYLSTHFAADEDRPGVERFVARYERRFKAAPGAFAALGHDAGSLVLDAVGRAGTVSPEALKDAINQTRNLEGLTGSLSMGPERHPNAKQIVILRVGADGRRFEARI
jgi:branched-chain amino acid transport system substrate-binding protein